LCDTLEIGHALIAPNGHLFNNAYVHILPGGSVSTTDTLRFSGVIMNGGSLIAGRIEHAPGAIYLANSGKITANSLWLRGDSSYNSGIIHAPDTLDIGTYTYLSNHGLIDGGVLWGGTLINHDTVHFSASSFDRGLDNHAYVQIDGPLFSFVFIENNTGAVLLADSLLVLNSITNYGSIQINDLLQFGTESDDNGYIDFLASQATITCGNLKNYGTIQGFGDICVMDSSINYPSGVITGSPDLCDATLTVTSEPYIDLNLGTVGPGVNWCAQTSCITTIADGTNLPSTLSLSPNPVTDRVRIEGLTAPPRHIVLLDLQGRRCTVRTTWNSGALTLERGGLPAGLYLLRVTTLDDAVHQARIVMAGP